MQNEKKSELELPIPKFPNVKKLYSKKDGKENNIHSVDVELNAFSSQAEEARIIYNTVPKDGASSGCMEFGLTDKRPTDKEVADYDFKSSIKEELGNGKFSVKPPKYKVGDVVKATLEDEKSVEYEVKVIDVRVRAYGSSDEKVKITYWDAPIGVKAHGHGEEVLSPSSTPVSELKPLEHHVTDITPETYHIENLSENPVHIIIDLKEKIITCDNPSAKLTSHAHNKHITSYSLCRISSYDAPIDFTSQLMATLDQKFPTGDNDIKELVALTLELLKAKKTTGFAAKSLFNPIYYTPEADDKVREYCPTLNPMQFQSGLIDMNIKWKANSKLEFTVEPRVNHRLTLYPSEIRNCKF